MEDNHQWYDPLLLTDVSWQDHSYRDISSTQLSLQTSSMANPSHFYCNTNHDISRRDQILEGICTRNFNDPVGDDGIDACTRNFIDPLADEGIDGRSMLGFSLTSPDLVICGGSPDIPGYKYGNSPESLMNDYWKSMKSSMEISLERGINGSEDTHETPAVKMSTLWKTSEEFVSPGASFELLPPGALQGNFLKSHIPVVSINAGSTDGAMVLAGSNYSEDNHFNGGDTIRTDAIIGDGEALPLYQTARFGNFSYVFQSLESGNYVVDLHFAEIIFTDGPPGMRVFDVFIQEQKVVSCIDLYARVGANRPLVISDLKTFVDEEGVLTIRFEGVRGSAIVSGISIREDSLASSREEESFKFMGMSETPELESPKDSGDSKVEGESQKLQRENEFQKKELTETKRALEELKRENQLKSRECQEAWKSLKELQNELMRKSMHVGSLAFAIEGQVKEKGKWFSLLRDLTRKLKILKMEHIKLSEEASEYTKCLAYIDGLSSTIQSKISHQVELHEDLKVKYIEGAKERKELYNKYLDLKGNIRVFCRCRPLKTEEIDSGAFMAVDFESAKHGELTVKSNGTIKKTFKFDAVFGPQADQNDVFQDTAPVATSVLDGYNVCIFAYGQTGTGKTFTMEGTDEARGVNFRTLEELFRSIKERQTLFRYNVSVSVLEVYNEQIRDLLVSETQPRVGTKRLEIRQVGEGVHHVPGLVEAHVNNICEAWEVVQTGSNARAVGSTNANEHSSRSHCIHCVMVKGENLVNGECTRSKLWLVDLAGSERIAKSEVQGDRLKETQNINRSLSALGDVISSLSTKSPHIPFRNSKLTHLLQDSLGGDSKTLMFVQISPNENDMIETLCSLNFASRVRGIELGPAKKQLDTTEFLKNKQMVEKTKQDMKSKEVQIMKMEETIHGLDLKIKEKDLKYKNLQDKVKELESQLLIERKLARQHVDTKIAEQQQQHQQMKQQQEEQTSVLMRPPLANNRPLGLHKNFNELPIGTLDKDQVNLTRPLTENNSYKPPSLLPSTDGIVKCGDPTEKENNPKLAEQPAMLLKRTGRASICTTSRRIPFIPPAPSRRNSLIPFPNNAPSTTLLPLPPFQAEKKEDKDGPEANCLPEQTQAESPKGLKSGGKKISSILRRSIQRKVQIKSPLMYHQYGRKGGINVGMEKVRVSIGSRGRLAHRVLLNNYRKAGINDIQLQKHSQKEKERPWNTGTAGRTVL